MITNNSGTFSANVKLHLVFEDQRIELGHLGPDFALLSEVQDIDVAQAVIELNIDGKITESHVRITSPITKQSLRFTFEPAC